MKSLSTALFALALVALPASSAFADTFDFSFNGLDFSGSGVFTATPDGGDIYQITGVTGEVDGSSITGLVANYPKGFGVVANDNLLIDPGAGFFGNQYFDDGGVSFSLADGLDVNLRDVFGFEDAMIGAGVYNLNELDSVDISQVSGGGSPNGDPAPSPTPEPASLLLLGTGVMGVAGAIRRKATA
jgi:PEP-CTERM motif